MHVPNISYNRSTSGALKRAQTPRRHGGSTCKDNSFSVTRFSISNPPSENPAYGPGIGGNFFSRTIKSCNFFYPMSSVQATFSDWKPS